MCFNGLKMGEWKLIAICFGVSFWRFAVMRSIWLLQWDSFFWRVCLLKHGPAKSSALGATPSVARKQSESAVMTSFLPLGRLSDRNAPGPFSLEFSFDFTDLGSDLPPFCWTFGRLCTSRSSSWFLEQLVSTFKWGRWGASDVVSVGLKARGWAMRQIEMIRSDCALTALASRQTLRWSLR